MVGPRMQDDGSLEGEICLDGGDDIPLHRAPIG